MKNLIIALFIVLSIVSGNTANDRQALEINKEVIGADMEVMDTESKVLKSNTEEEIIVLDKPSFEYYKSPKIEKEGDKRIQLSQKKAIRNGITDLEKWFNDNNLWIDAYIYDTNFVNMDWYIPYFVRTEFQGKLLTQATYDDKYTYGLYRNEGERNNYLIVYNNHTIEEKWILDFVNYNFPENELENDRTKQEVNWMVIEKGVLYVSTFHGGYANESDNINGFITAIDLEDNRVLWRSDTLVCNSQNFQIVGDTVVTGYGYTQEEDYIYLMDKFTGEVYKEIAVNSAPEFFMVKDNVLYVRTYDTNYEFEIE